jgi:hypothetical protein
MVRNTGAGRPEGRPPGHRGRGRPESPASAVRPGPRPTPVVLRPEGVEVGLPGDGPVLRRVSPPAPAGRRRPVRRGWRPQTPALPGRARVINPSEGGSPGRSGGRPPASLCLMSRRFLSGRWSVALRQTSGPVAGPPSPGVGAGDPAGRSEPLVGGTCQRRDWSHRTVDVSVSVCVGSASLCVQHLPLLRSARDDITHVRDIL